MATLQERLNEDLKNAMRGGDAERKDTLRLVLAAIKNARIDAMHDLSDDETLAVLQKQAKQRRDSIEQYKAGNRLDLVAKEETELAFIQDYLPKQLTEAEIEAVAQRVIAEVGATSAADMAKVMGPLMKAVAGQADGKLASAVARRLLGS